MKLPSTPISCKLSLRTMCLMFFQAYIYCTYMFCLSLCSLQYHGLLSSGILVSLLRGWRTATSHRQQSVSVDCKLFTECALKLSRKRRTNTDFKNHISFWAPHVAYVHLFALLATRIPLWRCVCVHSWEKHIAAALSGGPALQVVPFAHGACSPRQQPRWTSTMYK